MGIEAVDAQGKGIPQPSSHVKFFSLVGGGDDGTVHAWSVHGYPYGVRAIMILIWWSSLSNLKS